MARPKPKDPSAKASISMPRFLLSTSRAWARQHHYKYSEFIARLVREFLEKEPKK